mgnify:CR=1 FL=1
MVQCIRGVLDKLVKPLKIYTEENHASKEHWINYLVYPIRAYWGDGTSDWYKWEQNFKFYKKYYTIVDNPDEADVCFVPFTINYYIKNNLLSIIDRLIDEMEYRKIPIYVWVDGDYEPKHYNNYCNYIKYFGFESQKRMNEIIQPADLKFDLLMKYFNGKIQIKKKEKLPKVGFVGMADYPLYKLPLLISKNISKMILDKMNSSNYRSDIILPAFLQRKAILNQLEHSPDIVTNFLVKREFADGLYNDNRVARNQFIDNIVSNDYTFCYRGAANYSIRFYETLCLGRVPLFINTDCKLPFQNTINWSEICIWIEETEKKYISDHLTEAHMNITNNQFIERQNYCREIWVKYFSYEGFYKNLRPLINTANNNV